MSKYDTNIKPYLNKIKNWKKQGASEQFIYKNLNVSSASWNKYKNEHQELSDALVQGEVDLEKSVQNALIKRALGYKKKNGKSKTVTKTTTLPDGSSQTETQVITEDIFEAPSIQAINLFYKQRKKFRTTLDDDLTSVNIAIAKKKLELLGNDDSSDLDKIISVFDILDDKVSSVAGPVKDSTEEDFIDEQKERDDNEDD